jgi:hypothetical protein
MINEIGQDPDPVRRLVLLSFALLRRQLQTSLAKAHNRLMLAGLIAHVRSQLSSPPIDWAEVFRIWLQDADDASLLPPGLDIAALAETVDDCMIGAVTGHHVEDRKVGPLERLALLWQLFLLPALVPDDERRMALTPLIDHERARLPNPDPFGEQDYRPPQVAAGTAGSDWSGTAADVGRTVGIGSRSAPGAPSGTTGWAGGVGVSRS